MRKRAEQLNVRLTKKEHTCLVQNAQKCGLSVSAYVRMLITGFQPKPMPPMEYDRLISQLPALYTELQRTGFHTETVELRQALLQIQADLTVPERINIRTIEK